MTKSCPVPTLAQTRYGEIQDRIVQTMMSKIYTALQEAAEQAHIELQAAELDMPPPAKDYLTAMAHQDLYCTLCKADPSTFEGGRADIALAIIRNNQNIARHYWGADIAVQPPTPAR